MADHNVRAVALHPKTQGWALDSPTSRPLLAALEKHQILTNIDMGGEADAERVERILQQHPGLPVFARGMFWSQAHNIIPLLVRITKTSTSVSSTPFRSAYGPEWLVKQYGLENQLVFCSNATDMVDGGARQALHPDYADISPGAERAKIAGGNLSRLLKGLKPPREIVNTDEDPIMAEARQGKPLSPLVLDFHGHILDEGLHGAGGPYAMWEGGPTGVRNLAKRMGVDGIGVMSWNGPVSVQAEAGNRCVTAALDDYPDFYWGLGTFDVIHRTADEMRKQMEELYADKRYLGLKPYPSYGIPYSDPRYDCWWQFGNERHLYAGLHPVNWYQAGEFESICSRFPDLTFVAYHCGGDFTIADTCIALANKYPNFYMEITLTPCWGGIIDYLVKNTSADRVLFGSDLPMRDPRQQLG